MTRYLNAQAHSVAASLGLLILRIVVGGAFMVYGQEKMANPMGWLDAFGTHGIPPIMQLAAFVAEFVGGAFLIAGFVTPLASLVIAIDMLVAILLFVIPAGGNVWIDPLKPLTLEKNVFYIASMLLFIGAGAGRYSVDALLAQRESRVTHKIDDR